MAYENMSTNITRPTADNYYALLFVGVCNVQRYVLSLIRWTNLLHQMYGYPLANIRILVGTYGSSSWDPMVAGTDVTYDATRADLDDALAAYVAGSGDPHELGANDNLFIFTFNHGGQDATGCYLCCENFSTEYYAADFAARISAIQCRQIVLLAAQCHAGGFVDPFINALGAGTRGAVMAGCRSDQVTYEAICDKLYASAFNGRMIQDALDDNIDLGITGSGMGVYTVPGYFNDRIDWGPTGVISTREAFNFVYDHYVNEVRPSLPYVTEVPLYRQKPWMEAGKPLHIRLGDADLIMQDCNTDSGIEPSTCASPWNSPDVRPDNSDQFPTVGPYEYVPAHDNRFFVRTANRGTAPTDDIWRCLEVRGLGFTGGPVGPPRIDRATETSGGTTVSARLRPERAQTQYHRIMIGGDFGHGCVSAASWTGTDELSHNLWSITADNDQAQCNLNPASVSGSVPVTSASVNSNAGVLVRSIPVTAERGGTFQLRIGKLDQDIPIRAKVNKKSLRLRKGQSGFFQLELKVTQKTKDNMKAQLPVSLYFNEKVIGGVTFLINIETAHAIALVFNARGIPVPKAKVVLHHPGDPRKLEAITNSKGTAKFGPLNPGFYFAETKGAEEIRAHIVADRKNIIRLFLEESPIIPGKDLK